MLKNKSLIVLLLVFIFGLLLLVASYNFYWKDIEKSGFYNSDEGYYIQVVKTYFYGIKYFKDTIIGGKDLGTLTDYLMVHGGPFFHSARQGYILLISGISSLFLNDYYFHHGLQWSALFGIFSIFLLYYFTLRNFGIICAIISTSLFTFSSVHIAFARSVHTITISIFFLLLGCILYYESYRKDKFIKFAALCFGIAFSCHYNLFWIFPIVLMAEIYDFLKGKRSKLMRIKTFIVFSAIPLICIEIVTLTARVFLQKFSYFKGLTEIGKTGYLDYFSDFLSHFIIFRNYSEVEGGQFFYYFNFITKQHSLIFILLALFGLILVVNNFLKTRDRRSFFLGLLFLPFLFYSLIPNKADKMVVSFIPIFCIYIGIIPLFLKNRARYLIIIPLFFLVFFQFNLSKRCLEYQMDIQDALTYMRQRDGTKHLTSWMYISQAYIGKQNALDDFFLLGPTEGESGKTTVCLNNLQDLYDKGFHYYLCYYDGNHALARIARNIKPEAVYRGYYNVEGHYKRIPNLKVNSKRKALEIYDIKKIIDYLKRSNTKC